MLLTSASVGPAARTFRSPHLSKSQVGETIDLVDVVPKEVQDGEADALGPAPLRLADVALISTGHGKRSSNVASI